MLSPIAHRRTMRRAGELHAAGETIDAIALLREHAQRLATRASNRFGEMRGLAVTHGQLGVLQAELGEIDAARVDWWSALQLGLADDDPEGVAASATNLSRVASGDVAPVWSALADVAGKADGTALLAGQLRRCADDFDRDGEPQRAAASRELAAVVDRVVDSRVAALGETPPIDARSASNDDEPSPDPPAAASDAPPPVLPSPVVRPYEFEVVDRADGYREFWCTPTSWSYPDEQLRSSLVSELWSAQRGADAYGTAVGEFWSASDVALRLRHTAPGDLALRELLLLSTRWETGLNSPMPWFSLPLIEDLIDQEERATHTHFLHRALERDREVSLWEQYGMEATEVLPVQTGWDMRPGRDVPPTEPWQGAPGRWHTWSAVSKWESWPRLQAVEQAAQPASPGRLLLFVSHRWESLAHPDPDGRQLVALQLGLTMATARAVEFPEDDDDATHSGLPELIARYADAHDHDLSGSDVQSWAHSVSERARAARDESELAVLLTAVDPPRAIATLRERILLWYDYASMYQAPRNGAEESAFRNELSLMADLQRRTGTVAIAGDDARYVRRAWCFLELAVGLRSTITELTPSWGSRLGARSNLTRWASRSDQLIGALNGLGTDGIRACGLDATNVEDLPVIGALLASLPAIGRIHSDDSDLVAGSLPLPLRDGGWCLGGGRPDITRDDVATAPMPGITTIPGAEELVQAASTFAGAPAIDGPVGVWIYTTQRALSLGWAARAYDLVRWVGAAVSAIDEELADRLARGATPGSVACTWADPISLSDDGHGWTRFVPSTVDVLVIVTQDGLPEICRIYERIRTAHLQCGVPIVIAHPMSGNVGVERPSADLGPPELGPGDQLVVPRVRRSTATPRQMMIRPTIATDQVELLPALRSMPAEGYVGEGHVIPEAADDEWRAGSRIDAARLLTVAHERARVEALARSATASWDLWARPRLTPSWWQDGTARHQLGIFEQLVTEVARLSENIFERRALLYAVIEDEDGYALHPDLVGVTRQIVDEAVAERT